MALETLRLYGKLIQISVLGKMQYRTDFVTSILSVIIWNAVTLGSIGIIVSRFDNLSGWNFWDMVFLYNFFLLGHSVNSIFSLHIRDLGRYIIQGTFDQFLTRPMNPLVQLLGKELHYVGAADIVIGITGVTAAYWKLGLNWNVAEWMFFFIAVVSGTIVEFSLSLMVACLSFWVGQSGAAYSIFWQFNLLVQQYPIDIFGNWFRIVVTGLIPVAFINYYPSLLLLGKSAEAGVWGYLSYLTPVVAMVLLLLALLVWKKAMKSYSSTGN